MVKKNVKAKDKPTRKKKDFDLARALTKSVLKKTKTELTIGKSVSFRKNQLIRSETV
jgi:hypothetical protein